MTIGLILPQYGLIPGVGRVPIARILARSAVPLVVPADANEDILVTAIVPGNSMGPNGQIRVTTSWSMTNSANNKNPRIRFGSIAATALRNWVLTANAGMQDQTIIANRNAMNSQMAYANSAVLSAFSPAGAGVQIVAIDTTVDQPLFITGQKQVAGETLTLEAYLIELLSDQT